MKKFICSRHYENSYNKHVEEITRLQRLLVIEEQKLFELMQTKKQIFGHEKPIMARSQAELLAT